MSTTSRPTPKHAATTALERMVAELAYLRTGTRELTDRRPIPRDWPAMTNADGSPSVPLPTADPEKE